MTSHQSPSTHAPFPPRSPSSDPPHLVARDAHVHTRPGEHEPDDHQHDPRPTHPRPIQFFECRLSFVGALHPAQVLLQVGLGFVEFPPGLTQGAFHRRSVCAYGAGEVDHLVRQALLQVALSPEGSLTVLCEFDALAATVRSRARTRARTFALSRGGGVRRGLVRAPLRLGGGSQAVVRSAVGAEGRLDADYARGVGVGGCGVLRANLDEEAAHGLDVLVRLGARAPVVIGRVRGGARRDEPRVGVDTDVEAEEVEVEALDSYTLRSRARLTSCGRDMAHSGGGARRALEYRGDGQANPLGRAAARAMSTNKHEAI